MSYIIFNIILSSLYISLNTKTVSIHRYDDQLIQIISTIVTFFFIFVFFYILQFLDQKILSLSLPLCFISFTQFTQFTMNDLFTFNVGHLLARSFSFSLFLLLFRASWMQIRPCKKKLSINRSDLSAAGTVSIPSGSPPSDPISLPSLQIGRLQSWHPIEENPYPYQSFSSVPSFIY